MQKNCKKTLKELQNDTEEIAKDMVRGWLNREGSSGQAVKQENCSTDLVVDLVHAGGEDEEDLLPPNIM